MSNSRANAELVPELSSLRAQTTREGRVRLDDVLHEGPAIVEPRARLPHTVAFFPPTSEPPRLQNVIGACQAEA